MSRFLFYFGNVTLRYRRDAYKLPANRGDGKLVTTFYSMFVRL